MAWGDMVNQVRYGDYTQGGYSYSGYGGGRSRPYSMSSDTYAQDMRAYLARQEWNDYRNRFMPYEDALINSVMSTEMLDERLSAIGATNDQARQVAQMNADIQRGRYGVAQTDAQVTQQANTMDRMAAVERANAMNQTRTHIYDRNMNVLAGGSGAIRNTVRAGYGGGSGG